MTDPEPDHTLPAQTCPADTQPGRAARTRRTGRRPRSTRASNSGPARATLLEALRMVRQPKLTMMEKVIAEAIATL